MTLQEWANLNDALGRYQATLDDVDSSRRVVLDAIHETKRAMRDFEVYPHPGRELDPSRKLELERAIAEARKPRRPGEVVVAGGNGTHRFIMRIDPKDYPALARLEETIEERAAQLVAELSIAIAHRL